MPTSPLWGMTTAEEATPPVRPVRTHYTAERALVRARLRKRMHPRSSNAERWVPLQMINPSLKRLLRVGLGRVPAVQPADLDALTLHAPKPRVLPLGELVDGGA